jgi:conjugative transfer signal peptidase TraF
MPIDRSRLRLQIAVLAAISAAMVAMLDAITVRAPLIVYNASGSAPLGFYYLENRLPQRGETALVMPPPLLELLINSRGILPANVPLVKQIGAISGDEVCRAKEAAGTIAINGKVLAEVFEKDREGRPLPSWEGCIHLIDGEFFLLQPHPHSFDSRYFGPVTRCDILGVVHPLWTWNPDN